MELKRPIRGPEQAATPATPATGKRLLYPKADGWYEKTSAGVETKIGPVTSPSNMMTLDTAQTVTGVKTFNTGALIMTSSRGTGEPYSDANPPETLDMTPFAAASVATPASGKVTLSTPDSATLTLKDSTGAVRTIGASVPEQEIVTDYTSTMPTLGTAGLKVFSRFRGRRLPAFVGPTGQDSRLQPFMGSNQVSRVISVNGSAAPTVEGTSVTVLNNATAAATAVTQATTSFFTSLSRFRVASTATAGTAGELRTNTAQYFLSSTANMGGFHFVCRFGVSAGASGTRGFIGLSSQTGAYVATTNPSAQLNQIGFYWDAAQTTLRFMTAGSAAGTSVDLGTNFPTTTLSTYFYEVSIYAPSGGGQNVYWSATRVNDGIYAGAGPVTGTTTLPALSTLLAAHVYTGNGALASVASLDIQSLYLESDN